MIEQMANSPCSRKPRVRRILLAAGMLLTALAHIAAGQTTPPQGPAAPTRPDQGIFRGNPPNDERQQSLFLTGSVLEAYDDNIVGTHALGTSSNALGRGGSGYYSRLQAGLAYRKRHNTIRFTSGGSATFDYYPRLSRDIDQPIDAYEGGAGLAVQVGRGRLRFNQSLSYQPYFMLGSLNSPVNPDLPPVGVPNIGLAADVSLFNEPLTVYSSDAGFGTPLGRRVSMDVSYGYHGSTATEQWTDLADQGGVVRLNFAIGRRSSMNLNYSGRVTTFDPPTRPRTETTAHELQIGYSYLRQLSRTRSVRVDVGTGGAVLEGDVTSSGVVENHKQVLGYGGVNYQFGRTWTARGDFRRSLQVLRGLSEPFFGDSVTGSLQGLFGRRLDLTLSTLYSNGNVGISAFTSGYNTRTGSLRLRYALSTNLAISTEYMYSQYAFGRGVELPPGVLRELKRNVVRAGLTFGMPLLGRPPTP